MTKILAIGNSFSQDATSYLESIAKSAEAPLFVRNCYIGGCSLERHAKNTVSGEAVYEYQKDGVSTGVISVTEALTREKWDCVTVQQVSGLSGIPESYEPYLTILINHIKEFAPQAKIVFHRTWQYEKGSNHVDFPKYGCDPDRMYNCIVKASTTAAKSHGIEIIPTGDEVHRFTKLDDFNPEKGGVSLYRDAFHLGLDYGRYLAALVWFEFFTGKSAKSVTFSPNGTKPELTDKIKKYL